MCFYYIFIEMGSKHAPLGKADTLEETPFQTARREAYEEIGLPIDDRKFPSPFRLEHLCELPANLALTELGVRPCVSFLNTGDHINGSTADAEESLIPRLSAREVSAVFSAPFHSFLCEQDQTDPDGEEASKWYQGSWGVWNDTKWRMHNFYIPSDRRIIGPSRKRYRAFGLTARILVDAARIAYGEEPQFEINATLGEEDMIRRMLETGRLGTTRSPGDRLTREDLTKAAKV